MAPELSIVAEGRKAQLAAQQAVLTAAGIASQIICPPGSGHG